jgi:hypothetical protein
MARFYRINQLTRRLVVAMDVIIIAFSVSAVSLKVTQRTPDSGIAGWPLCVLGAVRETETESGPP